MSISPKQRKQPTPADSFYLSRCIVCNRLVFHFNAPAYARNNTGKIVGMICSESCRQHLKWDIKNHNHTPTHTNPRVICPTKQTFFALCIMVVSGALILFGILHAIIQTLLTKP